MARVNEGSEPAKGMAIFYRGLVRGESGTKNVVYYGVVRRFPRAEFDAAAKANDFSTLSNKYDADVATLLVDYPDSAPLSNGIIERYEVYEHGTGDVLMMWRIPYREKVSDA